MMSKMGYPYLRLGFKMGARTGNDARLLSTRKKTHDYLPHANRRVSTFHAQKRRASTSHVQNDTRLLFTKEAKFQKTPGPRK